MLIHEFWKIPFLRILIPFIAGIVLSDYLYVSGIFWLLFIFFASVLAFLSSPLAGLSPSYHRRWVFGLFVSLALFAGGAYLMVISLNYNTSLPDSEMLAGVVDEPAKTGPKSVKLVLAVREYRINGVWHPCREKIILNIQKDSLAEKLVYGDLILIKGNLKEIKNAGNPSEFDYQKFLARKGIHYSSWQNSGEWQLLATGQGKPLFSFAYHLRSSLLSTYRLNGIEGEEFGFLAALTLGVKDYLNDELIEAYSDSGAMHVLAVSGLHVGIIYIMLNHLLFFLRRKPILRILQALLFLAAIWLFALLTGLSPSVNRASAMITFVIIGKASGKKPSTYNSVAASAFILLLIDPQSLFNVGFQLSFLAVVAIIFFQPRVYRLFEPKSWLTEKIWSLTSVSIAAQIGTTALSIYYFQQFPVYAFVSNLFVIPGAFLVMVLAIALLSTSFIYPLAKLIAFLLSSVIHGLNTATKFIDSLPGSCIESISLSSSELILLYLGLTIMMIWLVSKHNKLIPAMLLAAILVFAFRDYRFIRQGSTKTFTIYNVRGKTAYSVSENRHLYLYADSSLLSDKKSIKYLLGNSMTNHFITGYTVGKPGMHNQNFNLELSEKLLSGLVLLDTLRVLHLNSDYLNCSTDKKLKLHYIILSDKLSVNLQTINHLFEYDLLIADASFPNWKLDLIKEECRQMAIPFYRVSESGAFVHTVRR